MKNVVNRDVDIGKPNIEEEEKERTTEAVTEALESAS